MKRRPSKNDHDEEGLEARVRRKKVTFSNEDEIFKLPSTDATFPPITISEIATPSPAITIAATPSPATSSFVCSKSPFSMNTLALELAECDVEKELVKYNALRFFRIKRPMRELPSLDMRYFEDDYSQVEFRPINEHAGK